MVPHPSGDPVPAAFLGAETLLGLHRAEWTAGLRQHPQPSSHSPLGSGCRAATAWAGAFVWSPLSGWRVLICGREAAWQIEVNVQTAGSVVSL